MSEKRDAGYCRWNGSRFKDKRNGRWVPGLSALQPHGGDGPCCKRRPRQCTVRECSETASTGKRAGGGGEEGYETEAGRRMEYKSKRRRHEQPVHSAYVVGRLGPRVKVVRRQFFNHVDTLCAVDRGVGRAVCKPVVAAEILLATARADVRLGEGEWSSTAEQQATRRSSPRKRSRSSDGMPCLRQDYTEWRGPAWPCRAFVASRTFLFGSV